MGYTLKLNTSSTMASDRDLFSSSGCEMCAFEWLAVCISRGIKTHNYHYNKIHDKVSFTCTTANNSLWAMSLISDTLNSSDKTSASSGSSAFAKA